MRTFLILASLLASVVAPLHANTFSWDYSRTGFRASTSSAPQTALSMRNGQTWPIVYGVDQGVLNAYSLFPVEYAENTPIFGNDATYWHPVGTNLTSGFSEGTSDRFFQAASGESDGFGISIQSPFVSSSPTDLTVTGTYSGGFGGAAPNTYALEFAGNSAIVADSTTIPSLPSDQKIFDYAVSAFGDAAAITQRSAGNGPLTYWQKSPLLGDSWISQPIGPQFSNEIVYAATADLLFDSVARPHVLGVNNFNSSFNSVVAYRFDVISASWKTSTLDSAVAAGPRIADVAAAANDQGIVGAAWVNNGVVKYAFMDTNETFPQWIVTTVTSVTPSGQPLVPMQGVGLAFDAAGLPVISFVENSNRQIWIAYDPPVATAPGDFNVDGVVDGGDLEQWTAAQIAGSDLEADADGDGDSDGADFLAWQRNLTPLPPATTSTAVPEPVSLIIAVIAACFIVNCGTHARRNATTNT